MKRNINSLFDRRKACRTVLILCSLLVTQASCISKTEPSAVDYLNRTFKWDVTCTTEDGLTYSKTITVGKDTVINGLTYRLVDNYYPMRQTKNSIYMFDYRSKQEILLYDFSLQVGEYIEQLEDPFSGVPKRKAKVTKTETITLADGRKARRIEYEQAYPAPREPDVEFVGNEKRGILGPLNNSVHECTLVGFYENNTLLYPLPE